MALPKQLQRQMAEATRIEGLMQGEQVESYPGEDKATEQAAPAETPTLIAEAPLTVETKPEPVVDHRYDVLKGKYEAEVPRLYAENRELMAKQARLEQTLEQLQRQAERQVEQPRQAPTAQVEPKDVEDFGSDMVTMVQRIAAAQVQQASAQLVAALGPIEQRLKAMEQQLGGVEGRQAMSDNDRFYATLASNVSDWETINQTPAWLQWLAETDALTGMKRQVLLDNASQQLDASRVVAIFGAYKATQPTQATQTQSNADALAKQVAPSRASSSVTPSQPSQQVWTDAAIKAFYDDVRKGKFVGRDAEYEQIDKDLATAIAEGRYRK